VKILLIFAAVAAALFAGIFLDPNLRPMVTEDPTVLVMMALVLASMFGCLLPWIVARSRKHQSSKAILAVCVLLGWTGIGWVVALIWSLTAVQNGTPAAARPRVDPNRKSCRACREPIDPAATICPHCRTERPHEVPPAAKAEPDVYVID
jgi:hypothetical protein